MTRSRTAMMNLSTSYEMVLVVDGVTVKRLGFDAKKTRSALMNAARNNGSEIMSKLSEEEADMDWNYSAAKGLAFGRGNVVVRFSGRTERDVANEMGNI